MKKIIILYFVISVAAFGQQPSDTISSKIILMFKNNTSFSVNVNANSSNKTGNYKIDEINRLYQSTSLTKQQLGRKTNKYIYIVEFPEGTVLKPIIEAYYKTGEIEYAEPDYTGTLGGVKEVVPDDQYYFRQWGLHNDGTFPPGMAVAGCDLDMQNAWEVEMGDTNIIVGILDSGVKFDHPELTGRTWINYNEIPGNLIDDDVNGYIDDIKGWNFANSNNNPVDGHGHGTNISGIIGANSNNAIGYSGVDWNCKLMILKGFTDGGSGNVSWWANAIYYAVDNGARVINMSFGTTNNSITLMDAVNYALENNVVLVACMMNENSNTVYYPAAFTGVIAVGSTDWDDTRSQPFPWNPNSGSNWGDHISVVAPGNVIFGLDYLSNTNYEVFFSGTSQATANVSGVASLLLAQDPDRTPGDIKYILEVTAEDTIGDPIEDIPGWDPYYGFGRVNAYHALLYSQPCLPEGITFETQGQIDNFQTNYPGCTEIEGSVIINGWISNLNGLNMLTSIGGNLEIFNPGELLTTLSGLDALIAINGNLTIAGTSLGTLTGLGSLNYIGGNLTLGLGGMFPYTNPILSSLTGLEALTTIGGELTLYANNSLNNLIGLNDLASVSGLDIRENINLSSLAGIENINVASVNHLGIIGNTSLASCNLQVICDYLAAPNGSVDIYGNSAGCNNPIEVAEGCGINLPCLPFGNYWFRSQADIDSFQGNYPGCSQLEGSVYVIGGDITNLNGLNIVTSISGGLIIGHEWLGGGNPLLQSLTGLENINLIGGDLRLQYNPLVENFTGLQNLVSIGGYLQLVGNDGFESLPGLENLTSIALGLEISGNSGLTTLTGLENVTNAGGYLLIRLNDALTSLSGLDNIDPGTITDLNIYFNDNLSDCDIQSICLYLANPTGITDISSNFEGCNSPEEVQEHCLTKVVETIVQSGITIIPNPSNDRITISSPAKTGNTILSIFNVGGEKVIEMQLTNTETQIDISALPQGVYFVRVQDEKGVQVAKMVKE